MTIASAVRGGLLILVCLGLSGCSADKRTEAVAKAAPYISDALSQPMPALYDKAVGANDVDAYAALRLGLALAAGRASPESPSQQDLDSLVPIDARFQGAKRVWLTENPPGSENEVPWAHQIGLTTDEGAVVRRIEIAESAVYWLGQAKAVTETRVVSAASNRTPEVEATVPAIDPPVLLTAEACVDAVRQGAKAKTFVLPEVVLRLAQDGAGMPVGQAVPDPKKPRPGHDYLTGAAACGSDETFRHYVEVLRWARLSDAPPHTH